MALDLWPVIKALPFHFILLSHARELQKPIQVKGETAVAMVLNNHAQAFNIWGVANICILTSISPTINPLFNFATK